MDEYSISNSPFSNFASLFGVDCIVCGWRTGDISSVTVRKNWPIKILSGFTLKIDCDAPIVWPPRLELLRPSLIHPHRSASMQNNQKSILLYNIRSLNSSFWGLRLPTLLSATKDKLVLKSNKSCFVCSTLKDVQSRH